MSTRRWLLLGLFISFCCGIQSNYASDSIHPRFEHRPEAIAKEVAVLRGEPYVLSGKLTYWPEFQNRVAFAIALRAVSSLGVLNVAQSYHLLRFGFAVLAYFVLWCALGSLTGRRTRIVASALLLLAFTLVPHFNHGWDHPSDFLDPIFMTLFMWATIARRGWLILPLAILGALNRESAVFAGLMWFTVHGAFFVRGEGRRPKLKIDVPQAAYGVALMAISYLSIFLARRAFGGAKATGKLQHVSGDLWRPIMEELMRSLSPSAWPLLLFTIIAVPVAWIYYNRRALTPPLVGMLVTTCGIVVVSLLFSIISELRMLIPMTMTLIFVGALTEANRQAAEEAIERVG